MIYGQVRASYPRKVCLLYFNLPTVDIVYPSFSPQIASCRWVMGFISAMVLLYYTLGICTCHISIMEV